MRLTLVLLVTACTTPVPMPTEARCPAPDPGTPSWSDFGQPFMDEYCTMCHASSLKYGDRDGAPLFHDFDSLVGVLEVSNHIDEQAGSGPAATNTFMPPARCPSIPGGPLDRDCPQPSESQRTLLSVWLACEAGRPHDI